LALRQLALLAAFGTTLLSTLVKANKAADNMLWFQLHVKGLSFYLDP
jgi:hypothetical protein